MRLTWKTGGILLGLVFFAAVWLAKPIGISTEFAMTTGILWDAVQPDLVEGATSTNDYFAAKDGSIAKAIDAPLASYGTWFAVSTLLGGLVSHLLRRARHRDGTEPDPYTGEPVAVPAGRDHHLPQVWRERFGTSMPLRLGASFLGGVLVLYGARLADGCTSGHMMSGMMQSSISGYIFAVAAFGIAVPAALLIYRKRV